MKKMMLILLPLFILGTLLAAPLNEGFESATCPPSGWTIRYANPSSPPVNPMTHSTDYAYQGTRSFRFSSMSYGAPYDEYLITPQLVVTDEDKTVSFWYRKYTSGSEVFRVGWSSTGTEIANFTWSTDITNASTTWQQYTKTDLPVGTKYVAVHYKSSYQYYLYIDAFVGPQIDVSAPPNPAVLVYPTNGGWAFLNDTLSWTSGGGIVDGYKLYISEDDNVNADDFILDQIETTYSLSDLEDLEIEYGHTYYWQVIPYNENGDAEDCPVWSFKTPTATQLAESFENTTFPPIGWKRTTPSTSYWTRSTYYSTHGSACMYAYTSTSTVYDISTPKCTITSGSTLNFSTRATSTSSKLQILYSTDRINWTQIGADISYTAANVWYNISIDLSDYAGEKYLAFRSPTQTSYSSIYVDAVFGPEITQAPPDPAVLVYPTNGGWAFLDDTLSWTSGEGIVNGYKLYISDDDIINNDDFIIDQTGTTFKLTDLEDLVIEYGHTYYWQVVPYNNNGDAEGCPVWSFKTPTTTQLAESFENATFPPTGWANPGTWSRNTYTIKHGIASAYKYGSTSSQYILSTPKVTITSTSTLEFWALCTSTSGILQIVYSSDRTTWTQLGSNITFAAATTWYHNVIDLSSLAGNNYYLGFRTAYSGSYYVDAVFGPEITPEAPGPVTLTSPANGATMVKTLPTFTWTAPTTGGVPTLYTVLCDTFTPPTTSIGTTTNLSFTPTTPLQNSTQYYWTVKAENSAGSSTATPFSFTTIDPGYTVIGTGTSTQRQPFGIYWSYERSAALYTNAQIGDFGILDKVAWNCAATSTASVPYKIYVKQTTDTALTAMTWSSFTADATLVAEGTHTFADTGWHLFELATPFPYSSGNLVIGVETNYGGSGTSSYPNFYYSAGATASHQYWNQDDNPPTGNGTLNIYLPNIMLHLSEPQENPAISVSPSSWDFGQTLIRTTKTKDFTITNIGGGTLSVSSIDIEGDYYRLTTNPAPIDLASLESTTFTVEYAPLAAGHHSGTVTIENTTGTTTVELVGDCYDPTIYDFPYMVDFTTWMPTNWSQLKYLYGGTPASGGSWVQDDWLNTATGNKAARLNIYGTTKYDWLITPPIQIPDTGYELKFDLALMDYGNNDPVIVGGQPDDRFIVAISNNPDMTSSTILREWNNTGSTFVYDNIPNTGTTCVIDLSDYVGTKYIAFYGESTLSNGDNDLMVDNFTIRQVPTGPVLYYTPTSLDFGEVAFGVQVGPKKVTVTNTGTGVLALNKADNTQIIGTGFAIDDFDFSLEANESGQINVYANATQEGPFTATLRITYGTQQCNVSLSATGLPEGIIVIGTGTEELGLPIDPYYRYSYSQSIFLQSEINKANRYIEKIYYYWNGAGAATNSNVWTIYLGHTDINEFANANAWIPITDFSVYNVTLDLSAGEGWVEINLDTPFYHTDQNLVIAVDENIYGYDSYPNVYFYCTSVETKGNRSISYADDSTNPDPTAPPAGTLVTGYPNIKLEFEEAQPPLPVELTSFTVIVSSENMVQISWVTQTETEMLGYYIYRSTSETLDNAIAVSDMIEALNTAEQHTYKFIDSEIYDSGTYYYWLQTVEMGGTVSFHGPVSVYYTSAQDNPIPEIPKVTELRSIYPNPFNPVAYIPYSLAEESDAHFYIYNVKGQLLRHIYVGPKNPGYYQISWDGKDINGKACGSGVYYIIMKAGKQTFQRKAVLMK